MTCTSPSKTFNIAGLQISNIFIPNSTLRQKFQRELDAAGTSHVGVMGLTACEAAYKNGDEWYQAMCAYVRDNVAFVKQYVEERLAGVTMIETEGTYLVWLDFRATGLSAEELDRRIIHEAKLWLGDSGKGFQRINAACPRSVLNEGLERLRVVVQ